MIAEIKRIFNSSNDYFHKPQAELSENKAKVFYFLKLKGYTEVQIDWYINAYEFFCKYPDSFDGATMTEDLPDIENLELAAMLHDYLYIYYNCAGSYKYIWMADKLMRSEMQRMNKSSWNTGVRFVLLILKTLFFYPVYCNQFKNRIMNNVEKMQVENIFQSLSSRQPKPWYKEFRGEITWTIIIIFIIIGYIWRVTLLGFIEQLSWLIF